MAKSTDTQNSVISNIALILGLVSSMFTIISFFILFDSILHPASEDQYFTAFSIIIALTSIVFIFLGIIAIIKRKQISRKLVYWFFNSTAPKIDYKCITKTISYEFISRTQMKHEKEFLIKTLHDSFKGISDKYKWTGANSLTVESKEPDKYIVEKLASKYGHDRYRLRFIGDTTLCKGDTYTFNSIINNIEDSDKKSSLHLSSGIYEITDLLILRVIFSNELLPNDFSKLEFMHYTDDDCYHRKNAKDVELKIEGGKKIFEWKIKNPLFGGKYVIEWKFD